MPIVGPNQNDQTATWLYWNDLQTMTVRYVGSNTMTWNNWIRYDQTTTGVVQAYSNADVAWNNWNSLWTWTSDSTGDATWRTWVGNGTLTTQELRAAAGYARRPIGAPALVRSEEEWTAIREEQERRRRIRDEQQKEARAEARKLMEVVLSKEQMDCYLTRGYFEVVGSEGGLFRIYHGTSGNLKQVVDGQEINALCVHPQLLDHRSDEGEGYGYLPTEDSMIAQAFAIMHDELGTVQKANVHRGQRHLRVVREAA